MRMPEHIPDFDLYAELEVAPTASTQTIDAAWRSLVKRHHPDAVADGAGTAGDDRIRRLNVAHAWLTDPERRARYDAERASGSAPTGSGPARDADVAGGEPDWSEIRREVHRKAPPAAARPRSLMASPIFTVAFGLLVIAVAVGSIVLVTRVSGTRPAEVAAPVMSFVPIAARSSPPRTPDPARALADGVPDRIDGITLVGETGTGVDLFEGDHAALDDLISRTRGSAEDLVGAYKAGHAADGRFLTIIALRLHSISGAELAAAFQATTVETAEREVSWTESTLAGRTVAVSQDSVDPEIAAYLVSSAQAMYIVITADPGLAESAISALP